jgi:prefoldin subunit 5
MLRSLNRIISIPTSTLGATFLEKIPEIEKTITLIERLEQSSQDEPLVAHYSLADAVFAKAQVETSVNKVYLWLGANVMLEYEYQEARELLEHKLAAAKKDLNEILEDLTVCRNQIVTAEVCVSRIYNWDVRQKRLEASRKK